MNLDIELSETKKRLLVTMIEKLEKSTEMSRIKKVKEILDRTFGKERNQIIKPSVENYTEIIAQTNSDLVNASDSSFSDLMSELRMPSYEIIVHYPEVRIKNSSGTQHTIRDMFIRIGMDATGLIITSRGIQGKRTTFSTSEIRSNYVHSHLPPQIFGDIKFGKFCTGSGEMTKFLSVLGRTFDESQIQHFFLSLKNFLSWESLEGTPFATIRDIARRSTGVPCAPIDYQTLNYLGHELLDKMFNSCDSDHFSKLIIVDILRRKVFVKPTEMMEIKLAEMITKTLSATRPDLVCRKTASGAYIHQTTIGPQQTRMSNTHSITFKGQKICLKVDDSDLKINETLYANPSITKYICELLSSRFTTSIIKVERDGWEINSSKDQSDPT